MEGSLLAQAQAQERVGCVQVCECCGHVGRPWCGHAEGFWEVEGWG